MNLSLNSMKYNRLPKRDTPIQTMQWSIPSVRSATYFARYLQFQNKLVQRIDDLLKTPIFQPSEVRTRSEIKDHEI